MSQKRNLEDEGLVSPDEPCEKKPVVEEEDCEVTGQEEAEDSDVLVQNDFGISEYTNNNAHGFLGVIKQRFSDFIVNEIDLEGNVVRLTDFKIPVIEKPKQNFDANLNENVQKILGDNKFNELNEFIKQNSKEKSFKFIAPKDKNERKLVHDYIKANFTEFTSNTVSSDKSATEQLIEIMHKKFNGANPRDAYKRGEKISFNNCTCVLYKENIDTLHAVNIISRNLRIQPTRISYAGTKDKRGKTSQLVSFFKIEPSQLDQINKRCNQLKLGNYKLTDNGLKLGDLKGNRFTIVLRQVSADDEHLKTALDSLKAHGFINYYGLQRFGTSDIPTHKIGIQLLLNNFEEAVDLILRPRKSNEKEELTKAREVWSSSKDAQKALQLIKHMSCLEKFLLRGLTENSKNDFLAAFNYIPRNMRLMYLHAFQSYVWNMAASERVRHYGLKPVVGDLVYDKESSEKKKVIYLDESNVDKFTFEDILLPLPGFLVTYPKNQIHEYYKQLLQADGLDINNMKHKIKEFSLGGDYRKLFTKPENLEYDIVYYNDKSDQLVKSDLDIMNGTELNEVNKEFDEKTPLKALVLKFNLPTSSYATMALRELLKLNTSKDFQTSLNAK